MGPEPRVTFVGHADEKYARMASDLGVDDIVTFSGKAGYLESLGIARNADLLLLMDAPAAKNVFLPSKIVDYLMLRRSILGLTPAAGAPAEALRALGCPTVEPNAPATIAAYLRGAFDRWRRGETACPLPDERTAASFHIERTTTEFEAVLHTVIGNRKRDQ